MTTLLPDSLYTRRDLEFINPFDGTIFEAYIETDKGLLVPRAYPKALGLPLGTVDNPANITLGKGYKLRDYQEPAVEDIVRYFSERVHGQCLLNAATGSGKTYSMAGVLASIKRTTLILSHLTMLGDQMAKELNQNLIASIGVLSAKSLKLPLPDIGICSFKLLENPELLAYVASFYSFVVVDECENAMTPTRLKVIFTLSPKYQLYLTATPSKELVKQTKAVGYLYDTTFIMEQPEESKVHSQHLMVDFRHLTWNSPDNQMMYKTSQGKFFTHSEILPWVVQVCADIKANGLLGTIWIVVDLNKLQDQLEKRLVKNGLSVGIIRGDTKKKEREGILEAIANRELDVLIGSAPLSAGLSIPELSVGIRLMPNSSSEELLTQQKGRLGRFCDFKKHQIPIWIDIVVSGSLLRGARARYKLYQQSTLKAHFCKPGEVQSMVRKLMGGNNAI